MVVVELLFVVVVVVVVVIDVEVAVVEVVVVLTLVVVDLPVTVVVDTDAVVACIATVDMYGIRRGYVPRQKVAWHNGLHYVAFEGTHEARGHMI